MNTHIDESHERDNSHRATGTRSARPGIMQTLKVHHARLAVSLLAVSGLVAMGIVSGTVTANTAQADPTTTSPSIGGCQLFPSDNAWRENVSQLPVAPQSAAWVSSIGANTNLHPDFNTSWGIPYTVVPANQPEVPINFTDYASSSDPGPYPIPAGAPIEGDDDSHVLVAAAYPNCHLYELYGASEDDPSGSSWTAASGAVFDLNSDATRPAGWTSADAAGLPILPGLAREDEVATGAIDHALRFTVSNTQRGFIAPATHWASSSTNPNLPPMGARFRLKASFDISGYTGQARVILQALKTYGMILADNGSNWFISGAPSPGWDDDNLEELKTVPGSAFEAVETGPITTDTNNPPQDPTPLEQTTPTINNTTPTVGDTLTATPGTFSPVTPTTVTYQWYRSGQPISGSLAQAQTYTVQQADLGSTLTVKVTGSDPDGNYSFVTTESDPTSAVTAATSPPPPPTAGTLAVDSSSPVPADGAASHTVTATLTTGGQAVAGQTVTFTTSPGAKLSQSSAITNTAGVARITVTSQTAGSYTVTPTATDSSGTAVLFTPTSVTTLFTTPTPSATQSSISVDSGPVPADGNTPHTVTVTVRDSNGVALPGQTVTVSAPGAVVSPVTDTGAGTYTARLTATTAGSYTVTASVVINAQTTPIGTTTASFTAVLPPAPPSPPTITSPASGATVSPGTLTITGTGTAGNTVTVSTGSSALTPTVKVTANGSWSLTPSTALTNGSYTLTATQTDTTGQVSAASNTVKITVQTPNSGGGSSGSSGSGSSGGSSGLGGFLTAIVQAATNIVNTIVSALSRLFRF